ncbi:MAG: glycoside hydrolase family 28 protein [Lachnospiraceae bacterium]|nr:glycoside hydrolase family 28 protein [Lachnospiraceae bacterium]
MYRKNEIEKGPSIGIGQKRRANQKYNKKWNQKRKYLFLILAASCMTMAACTSSEHSNQDKSKVQNGSKLDKEHPLMAAEKIKVKDLSKATEEEAWEYEKEILKEIREHEPVFGDYEVSIADFGAAASSGTLSQQEERQIAMDNTRAIYQAICDVNQQKEGGKVIIPAGTWYTCAIHLKSNVNLYLAEGAVLKFARDTDLYAGELMKELYGSELTFVRSGGIELYNYSPFIYANGADNIALTGPGTIDGQADTAVWESWRTLGEPTSSNHLLKQGETGVSVEERTYGESKGEAGTAIDGYIRPNFVELINCDGVLLEDFTTANSPAWQIHPTYCSNVTIRRLKLNSLLSNNDGIDPDSCKNVLIEENIFNTGDDCIAIKSGKNQDGRRVGIASENILILNNTMQIGHGGITLGSEASAGIRNVFAENNLMESLAEECCLRFKNSTLRGNILENIYYKNTKVTAFKQTRDMIIFQSDYGVEEETAYLESEGIQIEEQKPITRNVYIDGFYAAQPEHIGGLCETAILMEGVADSPISKIHFRNIQIDKPNTFMNLKYVEDLVLEEGVITKNRKKDTFENCRNITFHNVSFLNPRLSAEEDYSGIENFQSENLLFTKD